MTKEIWIEKKHAEVQELKDMETHNTNGLRVY